MYVYIPSTVPCTSLFPPSFLLLSLPTFRFSLQICRNCSCLTNSVSRTFNLLFLGGESQNLNLTSEMHRCSWVSSLSLYINSIEFSWHTALNMSLQIALSGKCRFSLTISSRVVLRRRNVLSAIVLMHTN